MPPSSSDPCPLGSCCSHRRQAPAAAPAAPAPPLPVCVIGAGPSGLAALRELLAKGVPAVCYEASPSLGGAFSTAYPNARLTSSRVMTRFSSFPDMGAPGGGGAHDTAEEYVRYLGRYAERFELLPHVRFGARVLSVTRAGPGWLVATDGGEEPRVFGRVAVCAGLHQEPSLPAFASSLPPSISVVHSSSFPGPLPFAGKNVLLVGLGESGSDIAMQLAPVARSLKISVRASGSGYVTPRTTCGEATDLNTNRLRGGAWGPGDLRRFSRAVRAAREEGNGKRLGELAGVWSGKRAFDELDLAAIAWNDAHGSHP